MTGHVIMHADHGVTVTKEKLKDHSSSHPTDDTAPLVVTVPATTTRTKTTSNHPPHEIVNDHHWQQRSEGTLSTLTFLEKDDEDDDEDEEDDEQDTASSSNSQSNSHSSSTHSSRRQEPPNRKKGSVAALAPVLPHRCGCDRSRITPSVAATLKTSTHQEPSQAQRAGQNNGGCLSSSSHHSASQPGGPMNRWQDYRKEELPPKSPRPRTVGRPLAAGYYLQRMSFHHTQNNSTRKLTKKQQQQSRKERKSNILDSVGRFTSPNSPPLSPNFALPARHNSAILKLDVYASPNRANQHKQDDDESQASMSLASLPPPERQTLMTSLTSHPSLNLSSTNFSNFFQASMDLSGHNMITSNTNTNTNGNGNGNGNGTGDILSNSKIPTQASEEQWARFKLLGRLGLGDIHLSCEAANLVQRNYDILHEALLYICALRTKEEGVENVSKTSSNTRKSNNGSSSLDVLSGRLLEEWAQEEELELDDSFFQITQSLQRDPAEIVLSNKVQDQLRDYIVVISCMYRDNPFHDFEHASNVLKQVHKLIQASSESCMARQPWNRWVLCLAALVHDVDHTGVPNAQLIKEKSQIAGAYKNKSVAEQNSLELAWNLLMEPCYSELRRTLFVNPREIQHFRKLLVTAVLATDIADKELAALRKGRALVALETKCEAKVNDEDFDSNVGVNSDLWIRRKTTFVLETMIQVADVSHTMSSFRTYQKWNQRLYQEISEAYDQGRADTDPSTFWYKGEFGFLDFYIMPLAHKLKECNIPDTIVQECIQNAKQNRLKWEQNGERLVAKYVAQRNKKAASSRNTPTSTSSSNGSSPKPFSVDNVKEKDYDDSDSDENVEDEQDEDETSVSISSDNSSLGGLLEDVHPFPSRLVQGTMHSGRVPSKSYLLEQEMKQQHRPRRTRSRSPDIVGVSARARSASPARVAPSPYSSPSGGQSERLHRRSILKVRPSKFSSPGNQSEGSTVRSSLRHSNHSHSSSRSASPASVERESSNLPQVPDAKSIPKGSSRSRSRSPSSKPPPSPQKQKLASVSKSERMGRSILTPSKFSRARSQSPASAKVAAHASSQSERAERRSVMKSWNSTRSQSTATSSGENPKKSKKASSKPERTDSRLMAKSSNGSPFKTPASKHNGFESSPSTDKKKSKKDRLELRSILKAWKSISTSKSQSHALHEKGSPKSKSEETEGRSIMRSWKSTPSELSEQEIIEGPAAKRKSKKKSKRNPLSESDHSELKPFRIKSFAKTSNRSRSESPTSSSAAVDDPDSSQPKLITRKLSTRRPSCTKLASSSHDTIEEVRTKEQKSRSVSKSRRRQSPSTSEKKAAKKKSKDDLVRTNYMQNSKLRSRPPSDDADQTPSTSTELSSTVSATRRAKRRSNKKESVTATEATVCYSDGE